MDHDAKASLAAFISTICGGIAIGLIGGFVVGLLSSISIITALVCIGEDHEARKK